MAGLFAEAVTLPTRTVLMDLTAPCASSAILLVITLSTINVLLARRAVVTSLVQQVTEPALVGTVDVAVQESDGDRLVGLGAEQIDQLARRHVVERNEHAAARIAPLAPVLYSPRPCPPSSSSASSGELSSTLGKQPGAGAALQAPFPPVSTWRQQSTTASTTTYCQTNYLTRTLSFPDDAAKKYSLYRRGMVGVKVRVR